MSRFIALRYRDFRLLWIGSFISWTGSEMSTIALSWMLYQMTGSALALGTLGLMRVIPTLALSLLGGSMADRWDRRLTILISQIIMTINAIIVLAAALTHTLSPLIIYASVFFEHIIFAFARPARQSLLPQLVPEKHFTHGVQITSTMWQMTLLLGPALGGVVMSYFGAISVLMVNVVSFIPFILSIALMSKRTTVRRESSHENGFVAMMSGVRFVLSKRIVISTMMLDFFVSFFSMAKTLFPLYADQILHAGETGLGLLHSSIAAGGIAAGLLMNPSWIEGRQGKVLMWTVVIVGLSTMVFAYSPFLALSCIALAVLGAADFVNMNIRMVIRQLNTPDRFRGRVAGIHGLLAGGGPMLGEVEAGIAATFLGPQLSVFVGGALAIAAAYVIARLVPEIGRYRLGKAT